MGFKHPANHVTIHARVRCFDYDRIRLECGRRRITLGAFFTRAAELLLMNDEALACLERDVSRLVSQVNPGMGKRRYSLIPVMENVEEEERT